MPPPVVRWDEDFETNGTNVRYELLDPENLAGASDYFIRTDGSNLNVSYTGVTGTFFGAQDIDDAMVNSFATGRITLLPEATLSGSFRFDFSIDLASDNITESTNVWEANDNFRLEFTTNNGVSWNSVLTVAGNINGIPEITQNDGNTSLIGLTIDNDVTTITGSRTLMVTDKIQWRVNFKLDGNGEDLAIDNITITANN